MKRPKVGAVIPARNEEKHLPKTLESLSRQVDVIVVVDDGSTDRTQEVARRYTEHVIKFAGDAPRNRLRIPAVINFGVQYLLENYKVDYILICGADDVLDPDYVPFVVSKMQEDQSIVIGAGLIDGLNHRWDKPQGVRIVRASWWHPYDIVPGWETKLYLEAWAKGLKAISWKEVKSHCQRPLGRETDWVNRGRAIRQLGWGLPGLLNRLWQRKFHPIQCLKIVYGFLIHEGRAEEWLLEYHRRQRYVRAFVTRALRRVLPGRCQKQDGF